MHRRRALIATTALLVTLAGCEVGSAPPGVDPAPSASEGATAPASPPSTEPVAVSRCEPSTPAPRAADADVVLRVGEDFQSVVDQHPAGTIYLIAKGVHREQQVIPDSGDTFLGEDGAVVSGARLLTGWKRDQGRWYVDGQRQQGFAHKLTYGAGKPVMEPGYEADRFPEELFVDGDRRLRRVGSLGQLRPGTWFFDYGVDRIWLGEDPNRFRQVETSVATFAFSGSGVRDVTVANLVIEKYASPAQYGAVGGGHGQKFPLHWTLRDLVVRDNHGQGITVGPGFTVENFRVHGNGQLGIGGVGKNDAAYAAKVVVRCGEIDDNRVLGYRSGWSGGGTKFALMRGGMLAERLHVHSNHGHGLWFDVENYDVVARSNLVENNDLVGIFYEISFGTTRIADNVVRGNMGKAPNDWQPALYVSNSEDVTVVGNAVYDNHDAPGIGVRHDHNRLNSHGAPAKWGRRVLVRDNDVRAERAGGMVTNGVADSFSTSSGVKFEGNTWRVPNPAGPNFFWRSGYGAVDQTAWRKAHPRDGRVLPASSTPTNPPGYQAPPSAS